MATELETAGGYLLAVAGLCYLWFVHVASRQLSAQKAETALAAAMSSGVVFVALLIGAGVSLSAVAWSITMGDIFGEDPHTFEPDTARLATQFGYLFLSFAALAAAVSIAATSIAAFVSGTFSRWVTFVGLFVSLTLLFSVFFIPLFALPVWVLFAGVFLSRSAARDSKDPS